MYASPNRRVAFQFDLDFLCVQNSARATSRNRLTCGGRSLRRAHRVDSRNRHFDSDHPARLAALPRARVANRVRHFARLSIDDHGRAFVIPGREAHARIAAQVGPTHCIVVNDQLERRPRDLRMTPARRCGCPLAPTVAIATSLTLLQNSTNSAAVIWRAGNATESATDGVAVRCCDRLSPAGPEGPRRFLHVSL